MELSIIIAVDDTFSLIMINLGVRYETPHSITPREKRVQAYRIVRQSVIEYQHSWQ